MYVVFLTKFRVDDHALSLLENLLHWDPSKRLKAREALQHPYFTSEPLPCDPKDLPQFEGEMHEYSVQQAHLNRK